MTDALRRAPNTADEVGKVRVQVVLVGAGNTHIRGNIVRSFTLRGKRVSQVTEVVYRALDNRWAIGG